MRKTKQRFVTALAAVLVCLCGFSMPAYAGGMDYEEPEEVITDNPMTEKEEPEPAPLTPDGNGTVVDNVTSEDGKEFYTVITPDEHTFFLVIDKQRDADNVYFLDYVTEKDLLSLTVEGEEQTEAKAPEVCTCKEKCAAGAVTVSCPVCKLDFGACEGTETKPSAPEEPEQEPEKQDKGAGGVGTVLLIGLIALGAGGAGYYFKVLKPKKELDAAEDLEDIEFLDGPEINEDDLLEPEFSEDLEDGQDYKEGDRL